MNRSKIIKYILGEPYIHFIIIGAILYLYYQKTTIGRDIAIKQSITIPHSRVADINHTLKIALSREARVSEVELALKGYYYDEILLQEAIGLKLHKKDRDIREKLIRQMSHILHRSIDEPTQEELYSYYKGHIDDYSVRQRVSLSHIYISDQNKIDIEEMIRLLNLYGIEPTKAHLYGDSFTNGNYIKDLSREEMSDRFGSYFAHRVWSSTKGHWFGEVRSKHGKHIVYITHIDAREPYSFDEVEDRVYQEYLRDHRQRVVIEAYKKLSLQYRLEER